MEQVRVVSKFLYPIRSQCHYVHRFNPESPQPALHVSAQNPASLLSQIVDRELSVSYVISNRVFSSSEEAVQVIKSLSKAAVDLNLPNILSELGQAEAIGSQLPDVLDNVPTVNPVMRIKVRS